MNCTKILPLKSPHGFSSQFKTSCHKIISDILGLCMHGTIDLEIYDKCEVLKMFFVHMKRKAAYPVWHRLPRKSSSLS